VPPLPSISVVADLFYSTLVALILLFILLLLQALALIGLLLLTLAGLTTFLIRHDSSSL